MPIENFFAYAILRAVLFSAASPAETLGWLVGNKGNVTLNNNNKRKRFRLLNFLRAAILDFMTSLRCLYCCKAEVLLFAETIGQRSDVMKSKMAARGKF